MTFHGDGRFSKLLVFESFVLDPFCRLISFVLDPYCRLISFVFDQFCRLISFVAAKICCDKSSDNKFCIAP